MTFVLYTFSYQFSAYIIFLSENWTGVCKKLYWHLTTYLSLENPHTFVLYTKCSIKPFLKPTITTKIILKEYLSQGKTPLQIQPQTGCLQSLFQGDVEFHFKLWFQSLLFKCKVKRHKVFIQVTALLILVSTGTFVSLCREVSNWHVRLPFAIQTFSYHRNLGPDSIKIPSSIYCTETHPVPLKKKVIFFSFWGLPALFWQQLHQCWLASKWAVIVWLADTICWIMVVHFFVWHSHPNLLCCVRVLC